MSGICIGSSCAAPAKAGVFRPSLGRCNGQGTDLHRRAPARRIKAAAARRGAVVRLTANRAFEVRLGSHVAVRIAGVLPNVGSQPAAATDAIERSTIPACAAQRKVAGLRQKSWKFASLAFHVAGNIHANNRRPLFVRIGFNEPRHRSSAANRGNTYRCVCCFHNAHTGWRRERLGRGQIGQQERRGCHNCNGHYAAANDHAIHCQYPFGW